MRSVSIALLLPMCAPESEPCADVTHYVVRDCPTAALPIDEDDYLRIPPTRCEDEGECEEALYWTEEIGGRTWLVITCRDSMVDLPDEEPYADRWTTLRAEVCQ